MAVVRPVTPVTPAPPSTAQDTPTAGQREQPLELMYRLMVCGDPRIELQAAIAAAPYVHPKMMPVKVKADDKDRKPNRFATPARPPRLVSSKP